MTPEMEAELTALNKEVEEAMAKRTKWLDDHMAMVAKFQIGDEIYDIKTGRLLGVVTEHYRYHRGDPRFDDSLSINYRYKTEFHGVIDNTFRQMGVWFGTKEDARSYHERKARSLA